MSRPWAPDRVGQVWGVRNQRTKFLHQLNGRSWLGTQEEAEALAAELNSRVYGMTEEQFIEATATTRMSAEMAAAMRAVLVHRQKWARAAADNGITQGGLLKAMRRAGLR